MQANSALVLASTIGLALAATAACEARRAPLSPDGRPIGDEKTVLARTCSPESGGGPIVPDALRQRATSAGSVRVIVRLKVPGDANAESSAYLTAISEVQDALVRELTGKTFSVTARYQTVPLLGLQASVAALDILASSTHVLCISEDALSAPLGRPGWLEN